MKTYYVEFTNDDGNFRWTTVKAESSENAIRILDNAGIYNVIRLEEITHT